MEETLSIQQQTKDLIDRLKSTTSVNGLGNSGNEYVVIVQIFLYKFLNDKFIYSAKKEMPELVEDGKDIYDSLSAMSDDEYEELCDLMEDTVILNREHLIPFVSQRRNDDNFAKILDSTMEGIASLNQEVFYIVNEDDSRVPIIHPISDLISGGATKKNAFCKSLIDDISSFSFETIFDAGYDFFSTIFEYLLKDYNSNGGGTYAEYYTPHSVANIMARLLVDDGKDYRSMKIYDPAAGTGTLLIALAHAIGERKCAVYTQDISEKSSTMLMLNLILNGMAESLTHVIKGNTMTHPFHKDENGKLKQFDFVVSNPPFKLDFSDYQNQLKTNDPFKRFFAGVPKIPNKKKESMEIYLCFFQHVIASIRDAGRGAIVVPTGFLTAQSGIPLKIRQYLVDNKFLKGVVSMPSNIFANTGTNVSVVFIDKAGVNNPIFIDASKLGDEIKDGKNKKTVLKNVDIEKIVSTFHDAKAVDELSVLPSLDDIKSNNYSFSAGQYFEVKIEHIDITEEEFNQKIKEYTETLDTLFAEGKELEANIKTALKRLKYE
ncbi:HsdM family class I SAM-dependent methyltransferase [Succinatimonas hippei]|uniref:site-specific DNA-methyltransferase (adenine-specific) n=1 Tax=Succinatimonas hippei (strain DSM 22608 / JCM 16073 / KCTC 15190 / YIT 12066) TaxID=762983 RepID=E8LJA0_SUCHY|nr:class I SAM-dependent DNA methyltransferase [Succinatimonas hippei]EFY07430.1 putative type I restriction-modification system, M subunit [Succinatimonas hippei YIT 12066]